MRSQSKKIFDQYALYYDLFYGKKDYKQEARYVHQLIRHHCPGARTMIDVGCGTGGHAVFFAGYGYDVVGVDLSARMIALARAKNRATAGLRFVHGAAQTFELRQQADVAVSLFHVMSYQTTDKALRDAFMNVAAHLRGNGIFVFDFWYGPAVLRDPPVERTATIDAGALQIERRAVPRMQRRKNIVTVDYHVLVRDRKEGPPRVFRERHAMRYLFLAGLNRMLADAGLRRLGAYRWLTMDPPGRDSWNACIVCQKPA